MRTMTAHGNKLPLYLLTGFLGSGKTSLLRQCLQSPSFSDTVILINEFGEIGLDHELIETSNEETVVLKGGCVCCTIREDLAKSIRRIVDLRRDQKLKPFSRLIIETSGLADPVPILITLTSDPRITQLFEFRGTVTTIDAVLGIKTLSKQMVSLRQAIYANRMIITKCDLVKKNDINCVEKTIKELNQSAEIRYSDTNGIPSGELFDNLYYNPQFFCENLDSWLMPHDSNNIKEENDTAALSDDVHNNRIFSFSWELEQEIDWSAFGIWLTMLLHAHGDRILRVKGILNIADADGPVAIHGVQHVVHAPVHMKRWNRQHRYSRLIFIVHDLLPDVVFESFEAFNQLSNKIKVNDQYKELQVGSGRTIGGRPRRRPSAPAWIKG